MSLPWSLHVVSHTHWDREWYIPFQQFRVQLVGLIEQLLSVMEEKPGYRYFMLDGQTVILEDYLEIRPDRLPDLQRLVADGRLLIGPWYSMPELSLVGAEAVVRNLLAGRRTAQRFGPVMPIGYLPDAFGHIEQMPQILRGFQIDAAVIWRGVDDEVRRSEFIWEGPDGSEVLAVHLPTGYANARNLPAEPAQLLTRLGHIRSQIEPLATTRNLLLMNGGDHAWIQPDLPAIIQEADALLQDAVVVHSTLPEYVAAVRRDGDASSLRRVRGEFRSGRHVFVLPGVLSTRMWLKQRNVACETALENWAEPFSALAEVTLSPAAWRRHNLGSAKPLIETAWRYLLQNQAHDTIAGCGVDQLYHEARTRFDWSEQMADAVAGDCMAAIADNVNLHVSGEAPGETTPVLAVFNGTGRERTDFVALKTKLPAEYQQDFVIVDEKGRLVRYQVTGQHRTDILSNDFARRDLASLLAMVGEGDPGDWPQEKLEALREMVGMMVGSQRARLAISGIGVKPALKPKTVAVEIAAVDHGKDDFAAIRRGLHEVHALLNRGDVEFFQLRIWQPDEIEIAFIAEDVPAYGYRAYRLLPGHRTLAPRHGLGEPHVIENEFFSVQASPLNGTLTAIDKETGAVFEGLNAFHDAGDAGDEYNYSPPEDDLVVTGPERPPRITLVEEGPVRWRLRVELSYELPARLRDDRRARSHETVAFPIVTEIALYRGVRRIDVRTEVDNRAADHRLRAHFPTVIKTATSHAEGHYTVVERPVLVTGDYSGWAEVASGTHPQRAFADLSDGKAGLLLANRGLPEFEALATEEGTSMVLTLLRCVGWLSRDDLTTRHGNAGPTLETPEAQCPGKHIFEYALVPHPGDWRQAYVQAHWFAAPLRAVVTASNGGSLPPSLGLLQVEPATVSVGAVKLAEDDGAVVVRVYNPTTETAAGALRFGLPVARAWAVNLAEEEQSEVAVQAGSLLSFTIGPAQVRSFKVRFVAVNE